MADSSPDAFWSLRECRIEITKGLLILRGGIREGLEGDRVDVESACTSRAFALTACDCLN